MEWALSILGSVIVAYFTAQYTSNLQKEKIREELKLEFSIETALKKLLNDQGWKFRTFDAVRYHIKGLEDDKIREHLLRAGAIAFRDEKGNEIWGLLSIVEPHLGRKITSSDKVLDIDRSGEAYDLNNSGDQPEISR
ncbi:MAG: hypothetical protein AAFR79_09275 [Pseudomonadota bacterium]